MAILLYFSVKLLVKLNVFHILYSAKKMPFNSFWFEDYVFLKPMQHATGQDIIETIHALLNDKRFDSTLHQVWDFSQTEELTIQTSDLKAINSLSADVCVSKSVTCLAMVARNPDVYYRIQALVTFTQASTCNSKVFTDLEDALYWMDIDPKKSKAKTQ